MNSHSSVIYNTSPTCKGKEQGRVGSVYRLGTLEIQFTVYVISQSYYA